jgi:hypothetical protein
MIGNVLGRVRLARRERELGQRPERRELRWLVPYALRIIRHCDPSVVTEGFVPTVLRPPAPTSLAEGQGSSWTTMIRDANRERTPAPRRE